MRMTPLTIALLTALANGATAETNAMSWTGYYAGVSMGALFDESHLDSSHRNFLATPYSKQLSDTDVLPGVQAGYNQQLPSGLVLGGELDFTYPDSKGEFIRQNSFAQFDKFTFENRLQGAIRAKFGYAFDKLLPYVTAGVSFADTQLRYSNEAGETTAKASVQTAWTLGGGLEYAFYDNLSLRTEYIYSDYGDPLIMDIRNVVGVTDPNGFANVNLATHSVRAALNYRF